MRISVRHELSIVPPPGTANLVLQVLLTPGNGATQRIAEWNVAMPGIDAAARFIDAYGNSMLLVNLARPDAEVDILVTGLAETTDRHGVLGRGTNEPVPALYKRITPLTRSPANIHGKFRGSKDSRLDIMHGLMARIGEVLGVPEASEQTQMGADGAQLQRQESEAPALPPASDYAHAFIGACRALDIPARYVTGYLSNAEEGIPAFHAWAEAYDDALGWIGFDPVLQLCPTDRHVRLATGLDATSAQPLKMVPVGDGARHHLVSVEGALAQ
jgi:transglutaminase-like putative cysteine protease